MGRGAVQNGIDIDNQCCGRMCCLPLLRNPTAVLTSNYQTKHEHTNPVHNVKPLANHDKLELFDIPGFHAMQLVTTNLHRATSQKSELNSNITLPPVSVTVLKYNFS